MMTADNRRCERRPCRRCAIGPSVMPTTTLAPKTGGSSHHMSYVNGGYPRLVRRQVSRRLGCPRPPAGGRRPPPAASPTPAANPSRRVRPTPAAACGQPGAAGDRQRLGDAHEPQSAGCQEGVTQAAVPPAAGHRKEPDPRQRRERAQQAGDTRQRPSSVAVGGRRVSLERIEVGHCSSPQPNGVLERVPVGRGYCTRRCRVFVIAVQYVLGVMKARGASRRDLRMQGRYPVR